MPPIVAQGIFPFRPNLHLCGKLPAPASDRKPNCFELQSGINAEHIVIFKEVNFIQDKASLLHCLARGDLCGVEVQHIFAVVQGQRVRRGGGAGDLHKRM